ncbi:MAG TPA: alpha/beta fold hydrolase [Alphaproteobacteria bacterium]|nr:alpha/beta fold hydrolase [Alphaproteobacteria bacterium]
MRADSRRFPPRARPWGFAAALLWLAMAAAAAAEPAARDLNRTLTLDGLERSYLVHVPPQALARDRTQATPIVIALHSGGGRARAFSSFTGFNKLADADGFIVAYPEGIEGNWNDGRSRVGNRALVDNIDDVGFILAIAQALAKDFAVDPKRVYVVGMSSGGVMALRAACDAADKIAAVAAVAAALPVRMKPLCNPSAPISVLIMNGSEDPVMPWRGGEIRLGLERLGRVISTDDTMTFWAEHDGCVTTPAVEDLPDKDPGDNTVVRRSVFPQCQAAEVVLYTVDRGGHTWPGGPQYLPQAAVGRVTKDIDATAVIWDFFKRQARE